jgi:beta-glucosidase
VRPSGKLSLSWPKHLSDNPSYRHFPGENGKVFYAEDLYVGYKHYDVAVPALFPFGFGLSYTSFKLGDFKLSSKSIARSQNITISLKVTNAGSSEGRESVQLYISQVNPRLQRPLKELKGFAKTKNLKPTESEELSITIDEESLSYYDDSIPAWVAEEGEYIVKIGASSVEIVFEEKIIKDKTTTWVGLSPP